jgi:hypothetical protein
MATGYAQPDGRPHSPAGVQFGVSVPVRKAIKEEISSCLRCGAFYNGVDSTIIPHGIPGVG